eukprot:m.212058 g.212058  ORF g.212058 m.212058 type:complete len:291 (-) comp15846_c0_seq1:126-998(-)
MGTRRKYFGWHDQDNIWKQSTVLIGPDHYSVSQYDVVLKTVNPGTLFALTYHAYPQCMPSFSSGMVLESSCLEKIDSLAAEVRDIAKGYNVEVWDGEGADHTATGGDFGHSFLPTFVSSFYYSWLQGALPLNGVKVSARQCLIGGNYGLLNKTTFQPNPDYWIAYIYRSLMSQLGQDVSSLNVNVTEPIIGTKSFAFTADASKNTVMVVLINLNLEHAVLFNFPSGYMSNSLWRLQGFPNASSTTLSINQNVINFNGTMPSLQVLADKTEAASVNVSGAEIVFALVTQHS